MDRVRLTQAELEGRTLEQCAADSADLEILLVPLVTPSTMFAAMFGTIPCSERCCRWSLGRLKTISPSPTSQPIKALTLISAPPTFDGKEVITKRHLHVFTKGDRFLQYET